MRIPALAALAFISSTAMVSTATPTLAQTYSPDYPVCLQVFRWGGMDIQCSYTSLPQCNQTASGLGAMCFANPYYAGAQIAHGPHDRRQPRAY
jgi:Protein of unknown function (DUF3551)